MGRLTDFYDDHSSIFGITGWLIAVIAIFLTIYLYSIGQKTGEISYIITTTKIFDSAIPSSDIVVSQKDGAEINDDIFASEITLWNSGDLRADDGGRKPDIPITISIKGKGTIIDTVLQGYNFRDITKYNLVLSDDSKVLQVIWENFRPGFGVRFTVLYTGTADTSLNVSGDIFEFRIIERTSTLRRGDVISIMGYKIPSMPVIFVSIPIVMVIFLLLLNLIGKLMGKIGMSWLAAKAGYIFPFLSIVLLLYLVLSNVWDVYNEPSPPI